jgi:NAD(P)-dependent dehydrogenase (short-subunit alcohol dehydrogenase family)
VETLTREDWQRTLNVNLLAPFFLTQALVRVLAEAGGSVVNISSIHARLTKPQFVAYATSKAALSAMTRSMCLELGQRLRVNAIEPAAIETEMLKQGLVDTEGAYEILKDYHPVGRIGSPNEVARAAVWLCSNESSFTNGACVLVDGGISNALHDPT